MNVFTDPRALKGQLLQQDSGVLATPSGDIGSNSFTVIAGRGPVKALSLITEGATADLLASRVTLTVNGQDILVGVAATLYSTEFEQSRPVYETYIPPQATVTLKVENQGAAAVNALVVLHFVSPKNQMNSMEFDRNAQRIMHNNVNAQPEY